MSLTSINPATGETIKTYDELTASEIDERVDRAADAFKRHRQTSFAERAEKMRTAGNILEDRADEWGRLMTEEMGKPIAQATGEARKCAWVCRYYADHAGEFLADEVVETDASKSYIAYQPLGPVLAVMPWNFPLWQVFRFAAPALMAGNVGLLKHASNVSGSALAIEQILREAGFDNDEFQTLLISSDPVANILNDPRVKAATLTGSEGAGRAVGGKAGERIKPSVLELGGSDPFIVLADADLDKAVEIGVKARMQNNGQSCIAAKRFIVEESIAEEYTNRYVTAMEAQQVGDPMEEDTDLGPLAREDLRDDIHDQVERALEDGATLLTGGHKLNRAGFYYAPTVLGDVEPGTVAFEEEIFGPVASIITAKDVDHAIELANDTSFGLGGAVFTEDKQKGEDVALRLEVGCAFVNGMVASDPRLPFGGVKESGYGRELSHHGIREFVNIKTVWIG
ncbi:MAG TPA: NAD-dependent succinate-semialdehyde dehydrogenase [Rhodothermales bacterium]|nr:NAD-dependent succinate-semialdehyde dehydrogenase [Rhodothermales bacterium]